MKFQFLVIPAGALDYNTTMWSIPLHPGVKKVILPTRTRIAAFTLIELLVVIAIISMLMSMLMPSLTRARQQARATACLASLYEIMRSTIAYSHDYHFALPPMRYHPYPDKQPPPGGHEVWHGWAEMLFHSTYNTRDYPMDVNYPVMRNLEGEYDLWVCKGADESQDTTGHYRVYEQTWRIGSIDKIPHELPLIFDANPEVVDPNDVLLASVPNMHIAGLEGEAYIDERHYGMASYVFGDGHGEHSETLKERLALDWDLDPETQNR